MPSLDPTTTTTQPNSTNDFPLTEATTTTEPHSTITPLTETSTSKLTEPPEENAVASTPVSEPDEHSKLPKTTTRNSHSDASSHSAPVEAPLFKEITSTQPAITPNLFLKDAALTKRAIANKPNAFRRFQTGLHGCNETLYNALLVCWIVLVYWIPGGIFIIVVAAVFCGFSFGFAAGYGAVALLMGNGILRAANLAHYTDNASAAAIGATGVLLAGLCIGVLLNWTPVNERGQVPWYLSFCISTLLMTLTGTIGSSLLLRHHHDIGDTDVLHATRAGALGGALLGPALLLVGPSIFLVLGIVLSPLWLAMSLGFRWVYGTSSEAWNGNMYRSSYCYTYGSCGDDPEIEEEMQRFEQRGYVGTHNII